MKILRALAVALFVVESGSFAQSSGIQFQSPTSHQNVSGKLTLSLAGDLSNAASVEYRIGNYRIALCTRPPFSYGWNSALAGDGNSQIEAIARDAFGTTLADVTTPIVLQNYGPKAEITNTLPATLSGSVPLNLHAYDPQHYPAYWEVSIDGEVAIPRFTDQNGKNDASISATLDTTAYPNGAHELQFVFHSNDYSNPNPPQGNEDFRGIVEQNVVIDNGRTFMEPAAQYLHVYSAVGATVALGCSRIYTNGDRDACQGPKYAVDDATVASVDAAGNLKALKEGFTNVTLTEGGRTTQVHVWVKNDSGVPHFTSNGAMSTSYAEGQSAFVLAPFLLAPQYVKDPAILAEVRRAGINTLTRGIYFNTSDLALPFLPWKQSFDTNVLPDLQWAAANGFRLIATGDDIARNIGSEAWRTLNWPAAKQAIQYAVQQFQQSGAASSIEMIDEASFIWGPNPQPPGALGAPNSMQSINCTGTACTVTWPGLTDKSFHDEISNGLTFVLTGNSQLATPLGRAYTVQNATSNTFTFTPASSVNGSFSSQNAAATEFEWFARAGTCSGSPCNPPVLDNAMATIVSWVKSATTVALSFPAGGISLPPTQRNWMGVGSPSDYASHFWDSGQQRPTYIFGRGIRESSYYMLSAFYSRQPYMQLNRPQMMEISTTGINYIKNSPAGQAGYNPPLDQLAHVGSVPKAVASSMFAAAAAGVSGLRLYQFETVDDYQDSKRSGPGGGYQTGAGPFYGDQEAWRSMGYAANLMSKFLQPYLLGTALNSPALGRNFVTGARQAASGKMLTVVNAWDGARQVALDFRPYKSGFGATRYRINDTYIKVAALADSDGESIVMDSGETLVYLFPNSDSADGPDTVTLQLPDSLSGFKAAVRFGYIYSQNIEGSGDVIDCTSGCSIPVDRRIGDAYYQVTYTDPCSGVAYQSPVYAIGSDDTITLPAPKIKPRRAC